MTIAYLVKDFSDEKGRIMSLNDLEKLDRANVYNVRIDNAKKVIGLTAEEIQLIITSNSYKEISIQEVYNRAQGLAEKALQI